MKQQKLLLQLESEARQQAIQNEKYESNNYKLY